MASPLERAAMRLALIMGWPNVDDMLAAMPAPMFWRWLAFLEIEPAGAHVADMRHAQHMAVMANAWRDPDSAPFEFDDFVLGQYEADTGQEDGAAAADWIEVKTWAMAHNARINK